MDVVLLVYILIGALISLVSYISYTVSKKESFVYSDIILMVVVMLFYPLVFIIMFYYRNHRYYHVTFESDHTGIITMEMIARNKEVIEKRMTKFEEATVISIIPKSWVLSSKNRRGDDLNG